MQNDENDNRTGWTHQVVPVALVGAILLIALLTLFPLWMLRGNLFPDSNPPTPLLIVRGTVYILALALLVTVAVVFARVWAASTRDEEVRSQQHAAMRKERIEVLARELAIAASSVKGNWNQEAVRSLIFALRAEYGDDHQVDDVEKLEKWWPSPSEVKFEEPAGNQAAKTR